jgi:hypothetical protein
MIFTKVKQAINCHGTHLRGFVFQLALSLIRSARERMYCLDKITLSSTIKGRIIGELPLLPFQHAESMLMEWLSNVKWLKRFKISHFNKNKHLIKLCLMHSNTIKHEMVQLLRNHGKNCCSFCYDWQTTYGCNLCKVILCKTARKGSSDASKEK